MTKIRKRQSLITLTKQSTFGQILSIHYFRTKFRTNFEDPLEGFIHWMNWVRKWVSQRAINKAMKQGQTLFFFLVGAKIFQGTTFCRMALSITPSIITTISRTRMSRISLSKMTWSKTSQRRMTWSWILLRRMAWSRIPIRICHCVESY